MEINSKPLDFADYLITEGMIELRPLVNRCAAQCGRQISDNRILCMGCLWIKRAQFEAKLSQQEAAIAMLKAHDAFEGEKRAGFAAMGKEEKIKDISRRVKEALGL